MLFFVCCFDVLLLLFDGLWYFMFLLNVAPRLLCFISVLFYVCVCLFCLRLCLLCAYVCISRVSMFVAVVVVHVFGVVAVLFDVVSCFGVLVFSMCLRVAVFFVLC